MNKYRNFLNYILVFCLTFLFLNVNVYSSIANDDVKKFSIFIYDGNIFYVGGSGPENYTNIQDAIDNASNGDTVFVYDDSSPYKDVTVNVNKSIRLQGENMSTTIIHGWCYINSDFVLVSGFTFQNYGPAFTIDNFSNVTVENCIFIGEYAHLVLEKSENIIIRNCSFQDLELGALAIDLSKNIVISNCDFFENENWMIGTPVITIYTSLGVAFQHCNIARNSNGGVLVTASSVKFNSNNIFNNEGYGIELGPLSFGDLKYNWWGSSDGPNITINARFWRQYHLRITDNGDNVLFGGMTIVRELLNAVRLLPWRSEPVPDAGQQTNYT